MDLVAVHKAWNLNAYSNNEIWDLQRRLSLTNDLDISLFLTQIYIMASKDLVYSRMDYFFFDGFRWNLEPDSCWSPFSASVWKRTASTFWLTSPFAFDGRKKSYTSGTTWGWLNDDKLFFFEWTIPLKVENCWSHLSDWEGKQLWIEAALSSWSKISSHPSKSS